MSEEKHREDFQVTDRRRFTSEGEARQGVPEPPRPPAAPPPPAPSAAPRPPQPPPAAPAAQDRAGQAASTYAAAGAGMEKFTFEKVVLSFAQTAMLQLGLIGDPSQPPPEPDLYGARETIDMLGVLQEKTRGNLTPGEQRVLENSLYELRMAWLEISRRRAPRR